MKDTIEIRPREKDPSKVDFYFDGKKISNITAGRVYNRNGILTAEAVITYDKKETEKEKGSKAI